MIRALPLIILIAILMGFVFQIGFNRSSRFPVVGTQEFYFTAPQQSVEVLKELTQRRDWRVLSSYFDLSGTNIDSELLSSGFYFEANKAETLPDALHHLIAEIFSPFPSTADFQMASLQANGEVEVQIRYVDQTNGNESGQPAPYKYSSYRLRFSPRGYRIVPN